MIICLTDGSKAQRLLHYRRVYLRSASYSPLSLNSVVGLPAQSRYTRLFLFRQEPENSTLPAVAIDLHRPFHHATHAGHH
jgi:hypothetical protein